MDLPKRNESICPHTDLDMNPSTDEWIRKKWYTYVMEYYSAIKKNEIMPFAATWMDLEIIILSEISQKQKDKYHMVSLICDLSISKYESKI